MSKLFFIYTHTYVIWQKNSQIVVTNLLVYQDTQGIGLKGSEGRNTHPPLAVVGRTKIFNIATMLAGFSDSISTPPCMFEKLLLGKFQKKG